MHVRTNDVLINHLSHFCCRFKWLHRKRRQLYRNPMWEEADALISAAALVAWCDATKPLELWLTNSGRRWRGGGLAVLDIHICILHSVWLMLNSKTLQQVGFMEIKAGLDSLPLRIPAVVVAQKKRVKNFFTVAFKKHFKLEGSTIILHLKWIAALSSCSLLSFCARFSDCFRPVWLKRADEKSIMCSESYFLFLCHYLSQQWLRTFSYIFTN